MKSHFAIVIALLLPFFVSAQTYAYTDIPARPPAGKTNKRATEWRIERQSADRLLNRKQVTNMKSTASNILRYLKDSCFVNTPQERPEVAASFGPGEDKLALSMVWKEANTKMLIVSNEMAPLIEEVTIHDHHYFFLKNDGMIENGYTCFTSNDAGMESKTWIVTDSGAECPYLPVTKKQYLEDAKAQLEQQEQQIRKEVAEVIPVRTAEEQEHWKKAQIEELKQSYSGAALQVRLRMFLERYKPDQQAQQEAIDARTSGVREQKDMIDSMLAQLSKEELQRPVFVGSEEPGLTDLDENPGKRMLVKLNSKYFPSNPANISTRFFLIMCTYDAADRKMAEDLKPVLFGELLKLK